MYEATIKTPLRPTESAEKVARAVRNVFPEAQLEGEAALHGPAGSLDHFAELLRRQRIRDAAREVLQGAIRGNRLEFHLNKQAAFVGRISFSAHAPLGDIQVVLAAEDLRGLVQELTSTTIGTGGGEVGPAP
ncbi:MAG: RNA-binding domain-containing protein [Thermoplasmata archaeon]|nr:RNA-binding domain-containing protein [Thermoplasmata archaeon]